ncbi:PQQ-binding-like beta-propeller repeat protein [Streptomyces luomodiensis]|uniref:PQQ-binding-like beta-propeller repeat protein n=1 Tax=Streptomyces luomodiensis TaxID=3026192 RepID=A0ABY9VBR4_9ACTN|nr:PQQ-binding-like beta-propeller repeat protein [Streptomyces sp. SCA4-21]WNF01074.1 PQQ-binding-like beta-propeller repeat protein [Streptomyces sp. SCA4-21]
MTTAAIIIASLALTTSCATATATSSGTTGYRVKRIVAGTALHTVNGLALAPDGSLLAASLASETVSTIDPATGKAGALVAQPHGRSDDLVVTPSGEILWTDPLAGAVKKRDRDGRIRTVAQNLPGVNSIAFDRSRKRLFVGQTFFADGLWEIDPKGIAAPRLVARDLGWLNAFAFGPDGMIYGPLGKRGEVVRIDPHTGATSTVATGFRQPVSVRFDSHDRLYTLDGATGQLIRVDLATGAKETVAVLPAAADNMVIDRRDHAYVSNMADSSVVRVDLTTGAGRALTKSPLAFPQDIASEGNTLYIADSTALRRVDPRTGKVNEIARRLSSELQFPSGISATKRHLVLTSELIGTVQVVDRTTGEPVRAVDGLDKPADAVELGDGSLVVSEPATGRLLHIVGTTPRPLAENLGAPTGLVLTRDGDLLVTDTTGGRLLKIDPKSGAVTEIARGLGTPRAVAVAPDGALVVLDTAAGQVLSVNAHDGQHRVLAAGLAVGHLRQPYARSGGLAIGPDGTMYVTADRKNSVYAIRRTGR